MAKKCAKSVALKLLLNKMSEQKKKAETLLQDKIIAALSQYGMVLRLNTGRFKTFDNRWISIGVKGTPDLLYVGHNAEVVWLEIKTPSGRLSSEQLTFHAKLRHMGHKVVVARSVDEALDGIGVLTLF